MVVGKKAKPKGLQKGEWPIKHAPVAEGWGEEGRTQEPALGFPLRAETEAFRVEHSWGREQVGRGVRVHAT